MALTAASITAIVRWHDQRCVVDNLLAVGIRTRLRPIERAAFIKGFVEKKFKNLIEIAPAAFGNAATCIQAFAGQGRNLFLWFLSGY